MKKLLLSAAIVGLSLGNSYAQKTRDAFSLGIKVGSNYSNVFDSQGDQFSAEGKFGLAAGAFLSLPLGKVIGIQPEVIYSEKGFKASGSFLGSNYSATRTTTYIDVPILLAIKPTNFITILAGPQYSFLVKQNNNFTSSLATADQQRIFDNDKGPNTGGMGAVAPLKIPDDLYAKIKTEIVERTLKQFQKEYHALENKEEKKIF